MRRFALLTALIAAPPTAQATDLVPTVSIGAPESLSEIIRFGPAATASGSDRSSKILWRADIHLPKGLSITRADAVGYAPIFLTLRDGRCFKLDFNGAGQTLTKVDLLPATCWRGGAWPSRPAPSPRPGFVYAGTAWDLTAWTDTKSGETMLVGRYAQPVLKTSMRVIAVGGIGSPDTPMTEVSLVGYVRGQLVATTVMLTLP